MNVTSEVKFNNVFKEEIKVFSQNFYKDNYALVYDSEFTKHLMSCPTRYNPVFYFYRGDNIIGASLAYYGEYTENELGMLRNFINPTTVVYDIGANIGVHTVGFAKSAKHVYAFEPNNNNFKLLDINTTHDHNVTLFDCAISNSVGTAKIEQYELGSIGNFGECKLSDIGQDCPMTTIDQLVADNEIEPPHVVKIDVESHELEVLQGMEKTIKENLPVIFYEAMHCDLAKIYDMLNGLAYKLYWMPCSNYNPNNFYNNKENIFGNGGVLNILALPFHIEIKTNLPEVISRDDTWELAVERIKKADAKD